MNSYDQVILITGSRDWTDQDIIRNALTEFSDRKVLVIHGKCKGADIIAGNIAEKLGFDISSSPADWKTFGRAAGPIRNKKMVDETLEYKKMGINTVVLAFHDSLDNSKGTGHCVKLAIKNCLDVVLYTTL